MTQTTTTAQPYHGQRPEIEHPLWCDPGNCCAGTRNDGRHQSAAVELPPIPPNPLSVVACLSQGARIPGHPLSDIPLVYAAFSDDEGEICDMVMYPKMAHEFARILTHTANLSDQ